MEQILRKLILYLTILFSLPVSSTDTVVCEGSHAQMCTNLWSPEVKVGYFLKGSPCYLLRQDFSWNLELINSTGLSLTLPWDYRQASMTTRNWCGYCRSKFQSLCLYHTWFTHWPFCPPKKSLKTICRDSVAHCHKIPLLKKYHMYYLLLFLRLYLIYPSSISLVPGLQISVNISSSSLS